MVDPGFPRGGRPGIADLLFGISFAENCMKIIKKWTEKGGTSLVPLPDPPLEVEQVLVLVILDG